MKKLFGTDGVRGVANTSLTPELAFSLGRIGSYVLTRNHTSKNNYIIIGRDTRQSGDMLSAAISAGICSLGVDVWDVGVAPTPVIAWLVRKFGALSAVVISASHNPAKDNGIKFFNSFGNKLDDEIELEIEKIHYSKDQEHLPRPTGGKVGRICDKSGIVSSYVDYIKQTCDYPLNKFKVGLDTANGANYHLAPLVYQTLGIEHSAIHNNPDGKNINLNCGSTHLDSLKDHVIKNKLDLGIAFDGDADRLLAIDEDGIEVNGDEIMFICSSYLPRLQDNKVVVATIMSNLGFELAIKKMNLEFIRAKVGDRYVSEQLSSSGAKIGGEQSGHIIFPDLNSTGDGLLTSLMLLEAIHRSGKSLKELRKEISLFPQVLLNVPVKSKNNIDSNELIKAAIKKAENSLGSNGRILVRPSGTEPLVRVMVEGVEQSVIQAFADEIAEVIKKEMFQAV
jgi:phosphoglucosamine mutase